MIRKVCVAIGLFSLLFSGAWILEQQDTTLTDKAKTKTNENSQGMMNVTNTSTNTNNYLGNTDVLEILKYQPREYVRIE